MPLKSNRQLIFPFASFRWNSDLNIVVPSMERFALLEEALGYCDNFPNLSFISRAGDSLYQDFRYELLDLREVLDFLDYHCMNPRQYTDHGYDYDYLTEYYGELFEAGFGEPWESCIGRYRSRHLSRRIAGRNPLTHRELPRIRLHSDP